MRNLTTLILTFCFSYSAAHGAVSSVEASASDSLTMRTSATQANEFHCPKGIHGAFILGDNPDMEQFEAAVVNAAFNESKQLTPETAEIIGGFLKNVNGIQDFAKKVEATRLLTALLVGQIFFEGPGEDYVTRIAQKATSDQASSEIAKEDKQQYKMLRNLAEKCGLAKFETSLEEYKKYANLPLRTVLILGAGQLRMSQADAEFYRLSPKSIFGDLVVSSSYKKTHRGSITVARSPGIMPDMVADVENPEYYSKLRQDFFSEIADEEGLLCEITYKPNPQYVKGTDTPYSFKEVKLKEGPMVDSYIKALISGGEIRYTGCGHNIQVYIKP